MTLLLRKPEQTGAHLKDPIQDPSLSVTAKFFSSIKDLTMSLTKAPVKIVFGAMTFGKPSKPELMSVMC